MSTVIIWCIVVGCLGIFISVIGLIIAFDVRYPRDDNMPWQHTSREPSCPTSESKGLHRK
ncbi:hypothetical protein ABH933_001244 [Nocardia sp. GP40]|uniref:hypothetical protein n=1 Tax=Nocardia sp. GP40 TaxID=3156268 RepID=UPI003D25DB31